ncbi:nuclease domain-containing protein [Nostoc sp. LPT]|uniref:nuclease domain-containing protein n=1 Tax=Nostoc sp. LPT TaxID=2815387 RepID=UPI001DAD7F42|nr:nuclease domain-containing protein [Nostoc sp. LPT]MBN4002228.1 hypothetical protein [Nostoc sp. LPT]
MTEVTPHPECPFTPKTFELLEKFKNNSSKDFYLTHEKEFKEYLEQPLQKIYKYVAAQLEGERVIVILLEVAEQTGYNLEEQCLVGKDKTGIFVRVFPNGKPVIMLTHPQHKTIIKLIPERTYSTSGKLYSSSFIQRPDIALEVQLPDGSHLVYIFDPKYKFESDEAENIGRESKPKKQDIDKMHTYCNAIRDNEGQQVVNYAAILYPGSYISYQDGQIEALPAYPGVEAELRTHLHRILSKALN